jgi:hypothetical protein
MKNRFYLSLLFVPILFTACKKEKTVDPGNGGGTPTTLLDKQVTKFGSDSSVVTYGYDSQKRLISLKTKGVESGTAYESEIKLPRNAQGIIQKYVDKSADYVPIFGTDSLFYNLRYDAAASRYTAKVLTLPFGIVTLRDSVAYTYNATGKVIQQESFFDQGQGGGYAQYAKTEYTYDAANNVSMAKTSEYDDANRRYVLLYTFQYEYDSKTSALAMGNEAFIIDQPSLSSTHNVTKITFDDSDPIGEDDMSVITYVYNSGNKPVSASQTFQSGSTAGVVTYTYK